MKFNRMMLLLSLCLLGTGIALAQTVAPKVVTHDYVARGSTVALGRCIVSGSNVQEQGFCWSTSPNPTIEDNRSTKYYTHNGRVYVMEGLTPSTKYYVRAYAINKSNAVGYGDVIKVITLPKGNVTWSYNDGGDEASNTRIRAAVKDAVEYLNTYTSIDGLHTTVNFGANTPTADCSYGGWMRVGPNPANQKTGTILHELGHAIGVGTHGIWYNGDSPMRSGSGRGTWLGERTTAVVRFLENNSTAALNGDGTHMWPYGVNGSHEDTGAPMLYIGNALIYQALGEDGLPPTGGFATPTYAFDQEDTIKYYIKNESEDYGLSTSYIVEDGNKAVWKAMSGDEALADDHAAWYISFNPKNCYYQLRNVATGRYLILGGSTIEGISDDANFHLMRSRVDVAVGSGTKKVNVRGYWLVKPQHTLNPLCLMASDGGEISSATFDLTDDAHAQRWIFLTGEELDDIEEATNEILMNELGEWVTRMETFVNTPHTESVEGTDAAFETILQGLKEQQNNALTKTEIVESIEKARAAILEFLPYVTPTDVTKPFDITYLIANAAIDDATGWSDTPTFNYSCMEYYETIFDFNQTTTVKLPKGVYQLRVQAFQRPGAAAEVYDAYINNTAFVTSQIYLGTKKEKVKHIAAGAQSSRQGGTESPVGTPTRFIPSDMLAASKYFKKGLYENVVTMQNRRVQALKVGIMSESRGSKFWTVFDNFRLYYYGGMDLDEVKTDVNEVVLPIDDAEESMWPANIYNIAGQCVRFGTTSLEGLPAGMYIVGGRKVIVK